ncbi:LytR C-terminal domain-containing protein [Actinopolyspora saharensis]|uniref:LytR cell envelope-related transcriptional attenuator n=1 Tax=Actinopolyspora saharensis TaxID=995062 RepID=A0A1H1EYU2_9ACTN|nr:LytR C-terminal domain-containing protein [Actinopolyspora saharensis]SDQ93833.1 LytR cell envelope-related transcriptional attenuator [Actinopolyspora saharensis]
MTSGEPPTGPSAARIGGFTLIGIGALALVFGTASVFAGESDTVAEPSTGPVATSSRTASESESTSTGTSPTESAENGGENTEEAEQSTSSAPPEESSAPSSPPQRVTSENRSPDNTGSREGGSDSSGKSESVSLRVYNNSKIEGLAHRAADDLRGAGFDVAEVNNYSGGRIPVTTVYYRPDTGERSKAETVARKLDVRTEPRFDGISDASPGVIVIVTKNYDGLG